MFLKNNPQFSESEFLQAFHKGKEHFDNNRLTDAKVYLEKAYKMKPNDEKVLNLLGMVYFKSNDLKKAEEIYSKLIQNNPSIYVLHSNLGLIRLKLGKLEEAKYNLTKALELQPNNPKAQVYLGLLYEKLSNYEIALNYFEKGGATKLIEQLKEKIASMKKEEEIEDADIIEVIDKKEKIIAAVEQKPIIEEEKIQQTPIIKEETIEKKEEIFIIEDKFTQESAGKDYSKEIRTMAKELGVDMRPSHFIEESEPQEEEGEKEEIKIIREMPQEKEVILEKPFESKIEEENIFIEEEKPKEAVFSEEEQKIEEKLESEAKISESLKIIEKKEKEEKLIPQEKEEIFIQEQEQQQEQILIIPQPTQEEKIVAPPFRETETKELIITKKEEEILKLEEEPKEQIRLQDKKEEVPIAETKEEPFEPFLTPEISIYKPLSLDYFSKDRFYIQPLTGADRFLLVDPHLLEIVLSNEIMIKRGTISSFSGDIKFEHMPLDIIEDLPIVKCTGAGVLFLSHQRKEILLFSLNNEEVNLEASHFLVAQGTLSISPKYLIEQGQIPYLNIKGTGTLGISIRSQPLTLNVLSSMPVNIYSDALIAWSGNLSIKIIQEETVKNIMVSYEENAIPLEFRGIGDVVIEQGSLWGDRRSKL